MNLSFFPSRGMTQLPHGTAHPLEVGGTHVVEHQRAVFQMPFGQFLLDLGLAFPQPVHRRVEGLGISLLHFEQLGQDARARFLVEPPSRRELERGSRIRATITATTRSRSSEGSGAMNPDYMDVMLLGGTG